jgi:hypothetical protein
MENRHFGMVENKTSYRDTEGTERKHLDRIYRINKIKQFMRA